MLAAWGIVSVIRLFLPPDHLLIAREAVAGGQFDVAAEEYQQHLNRYPEDWGARNELGLVLSQIDRPQALAEYRKVPPEAEEYADACREIVSLCLASERFKEAEQTLVAFTKQHPEESWAQLTLAKLYFREVRAREALPFAREATKLDKENAEAHFLYSEVLDELNRSLEMIEPLETVVKLTPDNYGAHLNLAYAYAEAGESEKSGREARWCLARNPADVFARRFLAMAERAVGNLEQAMRETQTALQVAPDDLECRLLEAELLLFDNDPGKALERLTPLYPSHPTERRLVALLARAAAATGDKDLASAYRQQVQKLSAP